MKHAANRTAQWLTITFGALVHVVMMSNSCKPRTFNESKRSSSFSRADSNKQKIDVSSAPSTIYAAERMGDVYFPGQSVGVSFGLEYEGMSPRVWEHFGLGSEKFLARVDAMPTEQQTVMIDWLMTELCEPSPFLIQIPRQAAGII